MDHGSLPRHPKVTASIMSPSACRATMALPRPSPAPTITARGSRSGFRMRVLIADDEAPARARLRQMLSAHADIEIAGEAETGPQTIELAAELHPDLILLDIQMPGATGIDVAACLPDPRPRIIFCTA